MREGGGQSSRSRKGDKEGEKKGVSEKEEIGREHNYLREDNVQHNRCKI